MIPTKGFPTNPDAQYLEQGDTATHWTNDRLRELNEVLPTLREMGLEWLYIGEPRLRSVGVTEYYYVGVPQRARQTQPGPTNTFIGWVTIDELLADRPRQESTRLTKPKTRRKTGAKAKNGYNEEVSKREMHAKRMNKPDYVENNRKLKARYDYKNGVMKQHAWRREVDNG